ncbi:hypothetical protein [Tuanshanicoccus lijuaniae]|uniref:hypothetical protein n=1 Tax=Aerococcaceae bacterium zg-1292 TaxID=2774330 RepID=UPI001BD87E9F|nr:hypothetical protein [Aerococcaceae bacterium zg-BR9]MBF6978757.1 hypothetical protein [Aerococcaceae bacterium zg-BR22]MBS4456795.1 hypothetical protein [Aerococcaceae bacterium zg-A91]MBS4458587.1 hypothetical protein [Aerococcaceae bacterium zg-BR33]
MSNKKREELKRLQTLKANAEAELTSLRFEASAIKKEIELKETNIRSLAQQIERLTKESKGITVSEHAIIRYLERVLGIDSDEIVEKILPEKTRRLAMELGNGRYAVNEGEFKVVIKNGVVVSVLTDEH